MRVLFVCLGNICRSPTAEGVFDTLLWNAEGEITECTRGNIALRLDEGWVTPALACGLLPGIGRRLALAEGRLLPVLEDWTPRTRFGTFITAMATPDRLRVARNRALVGFLQEGLG